VATRAAFVVQKIIVVTWIEAVLSLADRDGVAHHCPPILNIVSSTI